MEEIAAGTRSVQMLIQVVTALGMIPAVKSVNIPLIQRMMAPDRSFTPNRVLQESGAAMLDELARWAAAMRSVRGDAAAPVAASPAAIVSIGPMVHVDESGGADRSRPPPGRPSAKRPPSASSTSPRSFSARWTRPSSTSRSRR